MNKNDFTREYNQIIFRLEDWATEARRSDFARDFSPFTQAIQRALKTLKNVKEPTPHRSTTHRERFWHIALDHPRFSHCTIFAREHTPGQMNWGYSFAFCSNRDTFNRRVGRSIARTRYFQENVWFPQFANTHIREDSESEFKRVALEILTVLLGDEGSIIPFISWNKEPEPELYQEPGVN